MNPESKTQIELTRSRKVLFAAMAMLIAPAVLFLLAEVGVRIFLGTADLMVLTGRKPGPSLMHNWAHVDAYCAYRAKPGRYKKRAGVQNVNSYGFVSTPEIPVEKPKGAIRIAFFGGSSTAGVNKDISDEETWPWQTVENLRRMFPDKQFDFINASLGGYASFESYGRFWIRVRPFSPDIVVLYNGWNDMYYFKKPDAYVNRHVLADGSWDLSSPRGRRMVMEPHWSDYVLFWSQVLTRVRFHLTRHYDEEVGQLQWPTDTVSSYDPEALDVFRTNMRLFKTTANVLGSEIFVVKQATLITPELPDSLRSRCKVIMHGFGYDDHVKAFKQIYNILDEEFPREHVIDATSLSGNPELLEDHIHPTPRGCAKIGRLVAEHLAHYLKTQDSFPAQ